MKVIGRNEVGGSVIVVMTDQEWTEIQRSNGVPYDKRSTKTGAIAEIQPIVSMMECFFDIKNFRKEIGAVQKKWDKIATVIDTALEQ